MREIQWEKWNDPILNTVNRAKEIRNDNNEEDRPYHDSYEQMETGTGPAIIGPIGIIPINESNVPSKLFNFWMGHTNFNITHAIKQQISNVEGVESLDIFTRYRFRLGIGQAFREEKVKNSIEIVLCTPSPAEASEPSDQNLFDRTHAWFPFPASAAALAGWWPSRRAGPSAGTRKRTWCLPAADSPLGRR